MPIPVRARTTTLAGLSLMFGFDCCLDDEPERKLHVEIKPITNGANQPGASVDELKATIENFSINSSMFNTAVRDGPHMILSGENAFHRIF